MPIFYIYVYLAESCSDTEEEFPDPFWLRMNKQTNKYLVEEKRPCYVIAGLEYWGFISFGLPSIIEALYKIPS